MKNKLRSLLASIYRRTVKPVQYQVMLAVGNRNINTNVLKTRDVLTKENKIRVLFIVQFPEMWNSEKPLYDELQKDDRFQTVLLAVPKVAIERRHHSTFESENPAYLFFAGLGNTDLVNAKNPDGSWIRIKDLHPNYIFVQRPYSTQLPDGYSFKNLSKEALLCHIPYGFLISRETHLRFTFNDDIMCYSYAVFADSRISYNYFIQHVNKKHLGKCYNVGFPRFELFLSNKSFVSNNRKTILWTPRWAYGLGNGDSHFLDFIYPLIQYCEKHTNISLIIRPHPLMFSFFIEKGLINEEYVITLKNKISKLANVILDEETDYIKSFQKSDILITDFSSLIVEYYITGKPIIYCGDYSDFNDVALEMKESIYNASNFGDVELFLDKIVGGNDEITPKRMNRLNSFIDDNNLPSNKIKEILLNPLQ